MHRYQNTYHGLLMSKKWQIYCTKNTYTKKLLGTNFRNLLNRTVLTYIKVDCVNTEGHLQLRSFSVQVGIVPGVLTQLVAVPSDQGIASGVGKATDNTSTHRRSIQVHGGHFVPCLGVRVIALDGVDSWGTCQEPI